MAMVSAGQALLVQVEGDETGADACARAEATSGTWLNQSITGFQCIDGWTDKGYNYGGGTDECLFRHSSGGSPNTRDQWVCCQYSATSAGNVFSYLEECGASSCETYFPTS
jgi:hypothetical protein